VSAQGRWKVLRETPILVPQQDGTVSVWTGRLVQCPEGHGAVFRSNWTGVLPDGSKEIDAPCPTCQRDWRLPLA